MARHAGPRPASRSRDLHSAPGHVLVEVAVAHLPGVIVSYQPAVGPRPGLIGQALEPVGQRQARLDVARVLSGQTARISPGVGPQATGFREAGDYPSVRHIVRVVIRRRVACRQVPAHQTAYHSPVLLRVLQRRVALLDETLVLSDQTAPHANVRELRPGCLHPDHRSLVPARQSARGRHIIASLNDGVLQYQRHHRAGLLQYREQPQVLRRAVPVNVQTLYPVTVAFQDTLVARDGLPALALVPEAVGSVEVPVAAVAAVVVEVQVSGQLIPMAAGRGTAHVLCRRREGRNIVQDVGRQGVPRAIPLRVPPHRVQLRQATHLDQPVIIGVIVVGSRTYQNHLRSHSCHRLRSATRHRPDTEEIHLPVGQPGDRRAQHGRRSGRVLADGRGGPCPSVILRNLPGRDTAVHRLGPAQRHLSLSHRLRRRRRLGRRDLDTESQRRGLWRRRRVRRRVVVPFRRLGCSGRPGQFQRIRIEAQPGRRGQAVGHCPRATRRRRHPHRADVPPHRPGSIRHRPKTEVQRARNRVCVPRAADRPVAFTLVVNRPHLHLVAGT